VLSEFASRDVTVTERFEDLVCTYVDNVNFK